MCEKIIQIIPAPTDMWAVYAKEENEPLSEGGVCRVACLALMEDGQTVRAMVADGDGIIDFADCSENFAGFTSDNGWPRVYDSILPQVL